MTIPRFLDSLRIRQFRGLADVDLTGLGVFNLLLGANDVGKTSVLEAIFLLTGLSNLELPIRIQHNRQYPVSSFESLSYLFHDLNTNSAIELSGSLHGNNEVRSLRISAPETDVYAQAHLAHPQVRQHNTDNGMRLPGAPAQITSSSLPHSRTLHYRATINGSDQEQSDIFEGELDFSSSEGIKFGPRPTDDQKSFIIPTVFVNSNAGYSDTTIGQLIVNKLDHELLEILRQINPQIEKIAPSDDAVYVDVGLDKMIPLNMFGSGMARAAHVFSRCILGESRVLLIDEIENGLHHKGLLVFLEALLPAVAKRDIQVFATTHSLELLKILQGVLRRDTYSDMRSESKCFVLARNSVGDVRPYKYDYDEFDHCIQHGIEIR